VPEWRLKYLDYKLGKKKLKAIDRALRSVNRDAQTPRLRRRGTNLLPNSSDVAPKYSFLNRDSLGREANDPADVDVPHLSRSLSIRPNGSRTRAYSSNLPRTPEETPLATGGNGYGGLGASYGSFVGRGDDHRRLCSCQAPHWIPRTPRLQLAQPRPRSGSTRP
jgi:hypothetical protein